MNTILTPNSLDFHHLAGYSDDLIFDTLTLPGEIQRSGDPCLNLSIGYTCIFNWRLMTYESISDSIENTLGYSTSFFYKGGFNFTLSLIHSDDVVKLKQIHRVIFNYYYGTAECQRPELRFSYNFRIRTVQNNYIQVLRQSIFTDFTDEGKPTLEHVACMDISGFTDNENITLKVHRLSNDGLYVSCFEKTFWTEKPILSGRERQVLALVKTGLTTRKIAEKLFLSVETIKSHRKNILIKTGAGNLTAAINLIGEK